MRPEALKMRRKMSLSKGDLVRFKSGDIEVRTYVFLRDEKEVKSLKLRTKFRNILKIPHGKNQDDSLLCSICYFM